MQLDFSFLDSYYDHIHLLLLIVCCSMLHIYPLPYAYVSNPAPLKVIGDAKRDLAIKEGLSIGTNLDFPFSLLCAPSVPQIVPV